MKLQGNGACLGEGGKLVVSTFPQGGSCNQRKRQAPSSQEVPNVVSSIGVTGVYRFLHDPGCFHPGPFAEDFG